MFDASTIEKNANNTDEDNYYTNDKRIKIIWIFCLSIFVFAILFLLGSLIYLVARSKLKKVKFAHKLELGFSVNFKKKTISKELRL